ncbi:MAG: phage integrase SAM-like domain-containing protein [Bacteroidota bacterium]
MATVKFNLRSTAVDKEQPIYLIFRHQKLRVVFATGMKVRPKYWNQKNEVVRNVIDVPNKEKINNLLHDLRTEMVRFAAEKLERRESILAENVKLHLNLYTGKRRRESRGLLEFIDRYVTSAKDVIVPATGNPPKESTIKVYKVFQKILLDFAKDYNREVDFEQIDLVFYNDFVRWMQGRKYSRNYIGKQIKTLKTFLNAATERGINKNMAYKSRYFRTMKEESESVYLTEEELERLNGLDLTGDHRLEKIRDLFLVGAWTGLRYSDFTNIKPENIQGDQIHIEQEKTGHKVVIPILPIVRVILDKYDNNLPAKISNQKTNEYLKEICQLAKIDTPMLVGITKGGERETEKYKKWQLVTTHTARRSFATNSYKRGIPAISIMQITGHRTEAAFLKYIKLSSSEHARIVAEQWSKSSRLLKSMNQ